MNHDITVGKYHLRTVSEVKINKSVETLSDTATITLPGSVMNETIRIEDKIKVGDAVTINLGYGEKEELVTEFTGYLNSIATDDGSVKLECIDGLFHFKVAVEPKEHAGVKLADVLEIVKNRVNSVKGTSFKVDCKYDVGYDKVVLFNNSTCYDFLRKVQDELKANVFFENDTLCVYAPYEKIADKPAVIFDFARNIEKSDLKYVKAEDKKLQVTVKLKLPNGKTGETKYGYSGGETKEITISGIKEEDLEKRAESEYNVWCYTGFEGSFTGWLIPFVEPTYKVKLRDKEYPEKEGTYYVIATETTFSSAGGVRKVTLGRRLSE